MNEPQRRHVRLDIVTTALHLPERKVRLVGLVLALALVAAASACTSDGGRGTSDPTSTSPSAEPPASRTAISTPSPTTPEGTETIVTITGILSADDIEGGCAYLHARDGTRYEVIYPEGWGVSASPLRLTNPSGELVARGGDSITVQGREAREMASICQIGPIFEATEVVSVDAR
jgi:hypothetical protein